MLQLNKPTHMKKLTMLLLLVNMFSVQLFCQTFTEQTAISLSGVSNSSVEWGDYDNDGDLDILLTGYTGTERISKIYQNNGPSADGFTEQTTIPLSGVTFSSVKWGDYDNDGDLDIILSGADSGSELISKIYKNNGPSGVGYTEQTAISLMGVTNGSVKWGDYDNDGDLDILQTGSSVTEKISKIYQNNGPSAEGFTEQTTISFTGVNSSSVNWGDYDNDGDLDILLTGSTGTEKISKIYKNNGPSANGFTEQVAISLTGVISGSVEWGDYDNDGDLDILLTGSTGTENISKIYQNNGSDSFSEQNAILLEGVYASSVKWGDYDNDGDLDILLTGLSATGQVSKIYQNNGNNSFSEQTTISLTGVSSSSVEWGDYDNDGDLDILLTGNTGANAISKIYQNDATNIGLTNTAPNVPASLTQTINGSDVELNWQAATDDKTPSAALSYNVFVRSATDTIVMPHADLTSGYLRVPEMGNAQLGTNYILKNLASGTYYWKVQAIDNSFSGGKWSAEQSFTIEAIQEPTLLISEYIEGTANNKAIELYNATDATINLSNYSIKRGINGADYTRELVLSGTIAAGDVFVISHAEANQSILNVTDLIDTNGDAVYFNGDDAIALFKGVELIDAIGLVNGDPGDGWDVAGINAGTKDRTLRRRTKIKHGNPDWISSAGTENFDSEWWLLYTDDISGLNSHSPFTNNDIIGFNLQGSVENFEINSVNHTITGNFPDNLDLANAVYYLNLSDGALAYHNNNPIYYNSGAADFTNPVYFKIQAENGVAETWEVIINPIAYPYNEVVLKVNMSQYILNGTFNPSADYVDVACSNNNWQGSGAMTAIGDSIYEVNLGQQIIGQVIDYKFRINGSWETGLHELEGLANRSYEVRTGENVINHWYNNEAPAYELKQAVATYYFSNNFNDWSENGNHAIDYSVCFGDDRYGRENYAYYYNGSSNYVKSGTNLNLINNRNNYAITTWIKPEYNLQTGKIYTILSETNNGNNFLLALNGYQVEFSYWTNGTNYTINQVEVPASEWSMITVTCIDNLTNIYVNDKLLAQAAKQGNIDSNASDLLVGTQGSHSWFHGLIDDINIYNRGLTEEEVRSIYGSVRIPIGLMATVEASQIKLTWNNDYIEENQKYYIYRDNVKYDSVAIATINDTVFYDKDVVNATTYQYYITALDHNGNESLQSETVKATFGQIPTLSIYDIQFTENFNGNSYYNNQTITTSGIVTASDGMKYFIQDGNGAWNGIYVYDSNNPTIGDHITITGFVFEYNNMTEIKELTNFNINSNGNTLPEPTLLTTNNANSEQFEGVLLKVVGATCTNTDMGYGEWMVNDGSGDLIIDDLYFPFVPTIDKSYSITGLMGYSYGVYKMYPRSAEDIEEIATSGILEISLFDAYTLSVINNAEIKILNNNVEVGQYSIGTAENYQTELGEGNYDLIYYTQGTNAYRNKVNVINNSTLSYDFKLGRFGDFDHNNVIDYNDLDLFVQNWRNNDYSFELGPVSGTIPDATIVPDNWVGFEDLMVFTTAWNNESEKSELKFGDIATYSGKSEIDLKINNGKLEIHCSEATTLSSCKIGIKLPADIDLQNIQTNIHNENLIVLERFDQNRSILELNVGNLEKLNLASHEHLITIDLKSEKVSGNINFEYAILNRLGQKSKGFGEVAMNKQSAHFYPNPVKSGDDVSLYLENINNMPVEILVTNIKGQIVKKKVFSNPLNRKVELSTVNLNQGIYFVNILSGNSKIVTKIIIQ